MSLNQNTIYNLIESFDSGKMPTIKVQATGKTDCDKDQWQQKTGITGYHSQPV
jgi:hypothetical protein